MVITAVVYAARIHWITGANIWINLAIEVAFILNQLRVLSSQINQVHITLCKLSNLIYLIKLGQKIAHNVVANE